MEIIVGLLLLAFIWYRVTRRRAGPPPKPVGKFGIPWDSTTHKTLQAISMTQEIDSAVAKLLYAFEAKGLWLNTPCIPANGTVWAHKIAYSFNRQRADDRWIIDDLGLTEAEIAEIGNPPAVHSWPPGTPLQTFEAWIDAYQPPPGETPLTIRQERLEAVLRKRV